MNTQTTLPRRGLFGAVAGLAVAATAATAHALAAEDPDAELHELGRQHEATLSQLKAAVARSNAALGDAMALWSPAPEALHIQGEDRSLLAWSGEALQLGEIMNEEQVARCRKMHPDLPCILSPQSLRQRLQSRRVEILEAWDAWAETKERALAACGFPACGEEADALGEKLTELELRVFATKAHTPAGWRLKARVTYELVGDEQDGTYENHALHSLLRDLIAEERPLG